MHFLCLSNILLFVCKIIGESRAKSGRLREKQTGENGRKAEHTYRKAGTNQRTGQTLLVGILFQTAHIVSHGLICMFSHVQKASDYRLFIISCRK